jgi:hypothetical protein
MENGVHAEFVERLGHEIEFPHGHAAAQDEDIVCFEMKLEPVLELRQVVVDVIVSDALKAMLP